jgi:hypothetical protein
VKRKELPKCRRLRISLWTGSAAWAGARGWVREKRVADGLSISQLSAPVWRGQWANPCPKAGRIATAAGSGSAPLSAQDVSLRSACKLWPWPRLAGLGIPYQCFMDVGPVWTLAGHFALWRGVCRLGVPDGIDLTAWLQVFSSCGLNSRGIKHLQLNAGEKHYRGESGRAGCRSQIRDGG